MNKRIIVDIGMLVSFLVLLDYQLVRNVGHEGLALVFFLLLLLHTRFNRQWYRSLPRGRWNRDRKLTLMADILLLGSFAAVMVTGVLISHTLPHVFGSAPRLVHQIHHVAGYLMVPGHRISSRPSLECHPSSHGTGYGTLKNSFPVLSL